MRSPTLIAFTQAKKLVDNPDAVTGVKVITVPDIRWARRDIKTVMLLAPVLGKQAAYEKGAHRGLDGGGRHRDRGHIVQRLYRQGRQGDHPRPVQFHPRRLHAARAVPAGARNMASTIEERSFTPDEAYAADEAFLTSASQFVMPIVEIDGKRIGGGQPGPVVRKLRELFLQEAASAG